ncbi:HAD family hydrolase [Luethyella okanaganae]|uniref:HAD family hydrolase n=1 Tax=Luethyella okanaganae TaxID=69372 RepID=A0ABW1VHT0_9MICO
MPELPQPAIAFFDVDNTLMQGASLYHVGVGAWRRRLITARDVFAFGWKQARFVAVGENRRHLDTIRERALELAVGRHRSEVIQLANDVFDERLVPHLWPETVALAQEHVAAGREVWLVTATAQEVADVIVARLGLTGALGTVLESVDGVYTGRLIGTVLHGQHKADAAETRAAVSGVDLADCWAYSDSRHDIPLLNLVGNPVVVNPDATLRRYAIARAWPVMTTRPETLRETRRAATDRSERSKKR